MERFKVSSSTFGAGLFASQNLDSFDLILNEKPIVAVLTKERLKDSCCHCWAKSSNLKVCSQCKLVKFCSTDCQRSSWNWSNHKGECSLLCKMSDKKVALDSARLCLRFLFKCKFEGFKMRFFLRKTSFFLLFVFFERDFYYSEYEDGYVRDLAVIIFKYMKSVYSTIEISVKLAFLHVSN